MNCDNCTTGITGKYSTKVVLADDRWNKLTICPTCNTRLKQHERSPEGRRFITRKLRRIARNQPGEEALSIDGLQTPQP